MRALTWLLLVLGALRREPRTAVQLSEVMQDESVRNQPLYIATVSVKGNERTKIDVIYAELQPALKAKTFADCCVELRAAQDRLAAMELFRSVGVFCDLSSSDARSMDVTITLDEKGLLAARVGSETDVNDVTLNGALMLRNVLGRGERVEYSMATGTALTSSLTSKFRLAFIKPDLARPGRSWSVALLRDGVDSQERSSHTEMHKGLRANHMFVTKYFDHELAYEALWRHVCDVQPTASFAVRSMAGHTLKSALSHTLVFDRRDDPVLPRSGSYVSFSQEVAGLGGNVAFAKGEVKALAAVMPHRMLSFSSVLAAGLMVPLGAHTTVVSDRFFLGGPMDLRGFKWHGVGCQERRIETGDVRSTDAIGGEAYWKASAAVYARLHANWGVYAIGFVNAGALASLDRKALAASSAADVLQATRLSYGGGMALRTAMGIIEITYAVPVWALAGDRKRRGFQLGIAMSMP